MGAVGGLGLVAGDFHAWICELSAGRSMRSLSSFCIFTKHLTPGTAKNTEVFCIITDTKVCYSGWGFP